MNFGLGDDEKKALSSIYEIDPLVIKQIEERREKTSAAENTIKNILETAPTAPPPPSLAEDPTDQILNNANYDYELKDRQLESLLDSLSLLDVSIDKTDEVIQKLDNKALLLIKEINDAINSVKKAYNNEINIGCKSDLTWKYLGSSTRYNPITMLNEVFTFYKVVKDSSYKITTPYYGIKYYRKPINRDYGFTIVSEVRGSISAGSSTLGIVSIGGTVGIKTGDEVTDNLVAPQAFLIGNLPTVVGFGTTNIVGLTTTISGNVSLGSSIIAHTGIGTTGDIYVGNYVINDDVFDSDTKVVGFGTTTSTIEYSDGTSIITSTVIVNSIILDKNSIGFGTNIEIGFGTFATYPSVKLSQSSNLTLENELFTFIRQELDLTANFNYTSNPIDPITIGIIDNSTVGVGHKALLVNNGSSSKTTQWRQVANEPEPSVGANSAVYYDGDEQWPYAFGYAEEGERYVFDGFTSPGYTSVSPTGIGTSVCVSYAASITTAETNLQTIINKNLPVIQKYISAASVLRKFRDRDELTAWGYLQSASHTRGEMDSLGTDIKTLNSIDFKSL